MLKSRTSQTSPCNIVSLKVCCNWSRCNLQVRLTHSQANDASTANAAGRQRRNQFWVQLHSGQVQHGRRLFSVYDQLFAVSWNTYTHTHIHMEEWDMRTAQTAADHFVTHTHGAEAVTAWQAMVTTQQQRSSSRSWTILRYGARAATTRSCSLSLIHSFSPAIDETYVSCFRRTCCSPTCSIQTHTHTQAHISDSHT